MISVNGVIVEQKHFPDGTQRLLDFQEQRGIKVTTNFGYYTINKKSFTITFICTINDISSFDSDNFSYIIIISQSKSNTRYNCILTV